MNQVLIGPLFRWEDNIKAELRNIGCEVVDWRLVQNRNQCLDIVSTVISFQVP
jgi:hypothetical protein